MRTTIRIDDDLLRELREIAEQEKGSLAEIVNRTLRRGLRGSDDPVKAQRPYRERVFSLGEPRVPLVKALAVAAEMEDVEALEEIARRK
jgi:Arc/MetJ family transcription regulator